MRKEVHLDPKTIEKLQKLADADRRSLKAFMQKVLEDYANASMFKRMIKKKI